MLQLQLITGDVTEIREGYAIVRGGETVQTFSLDWYRIPRQEGSSIERREHIEHCDMCGRPLDQMYGDDFFIEDADGSHVYCEVHWPDGDPYLTVHVRAVRRLEGGNASHLSSARTGTVSAIPEMHVA